MGNSRVTRATRERPGPCWMSWQSGPEPWPAFAGCRPPGGEPRSRAGGPMTHARGILRLACVMAALALATTAVRAQAEQSATQFYMAYRAAFAKATKVDELLPYMSKARRAEIEKTPAGERAKMFEFIKEFDTVTQIKVVKEGK